MSAARVFVCIALDHLVYSVGLREGTAVASEPPSLRRLSTSQLEAAMGHFFPLIEKSLLDDILTLSYDMKNLRCSEVSRSAPDCSVVVFAPKC